jgi:hypothetical protein
MEPRFSQWLPGEEIPEKHWMYRWAKKYWFNDFHAYSKVTPSAVSKTLELQKRLKPKSAHMPV